MKAGYFECLKELSDAARNANLTRMGGLVMSLLKRILND